MLRWLLPVGVDEAGYVTHVLVFVSCRSHGLSTVVVVVVVVDGMYVCACVCPAEAGSSPVIGLSAFPYKAVMTDVNFFDTSNGLVYVQASYPLTDAAACSTDETQECLVGIDVATGVVKSTKGESSRM